MYSGLCDRIQSAFDQIEFSEPWDHAMTIVRPMRATKNITTL